MPSWRRQQSEVVGGGQAHSGSLYRALVPLVCTRCGGTVAPGDTFTRSSRGAAGASRGGGALYVVCWACGQQQQGPPGTQEVADGG